MRYLMFFFRRRNNTTIQPATLNKPGTMALTKLTDLGSRSHHAVFLDFGKRIVHKAEKALIHM